MPPEPGHDGLDQWDPVIGVEVVGALDDDPLPWLICGLIQSCAVLRGQELVGGADDEQDRHVHLLDEGEGSPLIQHPDDVVLLALDAGDVQLPLPRGEVG